MPKGRGAMPMRRIFLRSTRRRNEFANVPSTHAEPCRAVVAPAAVTLRATAPRKCGFAAMATAAVLAVSGPHPAHAQSASFQGIRFPGGGGKSGSARAGDYQAVT